MENRENREYAVVGGSEWGLNLDKRGSIKNTKSYKCRGILITTYKIIIQHPNNTLACPLTQLRGLGSSENLGGGRCE